MSGLNERVGQPVVSEVGTQPKRIGRTNGVVQGYVASIQRPLTSTATARPTSGQPRTDTIEPWGSCRNAAESPASKVTIGRAPRVAFRE